MAITIAPPRLSDRAGSRVNDVSKPWARTQMHPASMPMTGLVADDVRLYREIVSRWFADCGFKPTNASDGRSAWTLFEQHLPAVVVTDLDMPVESGFELIRRIRDYDQRHRRRTRIVVMSSLQDDQLDAFATRAGGDAVWVKPLSKPVVVEQLRRWANDIDDSSVRHDAKPSSRDRTHRSDSVNQSDYASGPKVSPMMRRLFNRSVTPNVSSVSPRNN